MNQTPKIVGAHHTVTLPVDFSEMSQEGNNLFDARFPLKDKNLGYKQDKMPSTLDTDLQKYFGFGKKQFKTIVKKPGVKFGFKLSNYIHPSDSVQTVNKILLEIAQHIEYIKSSPVKEIFNQQFKEELRAKCYSRFPNKYLIKLHIGITFKYKTKQGIEKVDTNRNIERSLIEYMSPKEIKTFTSTYPRQMYEYHGVLLKNYEEGIGGTGPFNVLGINELLEERIPNISHYKIEDIWLEEKPIIIEHSTFTKNQFIELQDELLERSSVLSDNFLKYAGGIHILAKKETESKCVETQLLEFFLNPGYTDPINKIPEVYQSNNSIDLNETSLRKYLDSLPKKQEGEGFSTRQLAFMCVDIQLNMYALDHDSKCFLKVTQFSGDVWPRGQSGNVRHHPLVFYAFNKHKYLITHPESIKSIAESCKDASDSRSFQTTDEVISEALPIFGADERSVKDLLEAEEGHYIFEKDSLEEEVFEYMQSTDLSPMIQLRDNKIIGFTVSTVSQPKPLPPPPVKPKRNEFEKGKKGQPGYDSAIRKYEKLKTDHEKAKIAFRSTSTDKKNITHRFSCNPNFLEGFPHEAVEQVCKAVNIPFHNQGLGALALELCKEKRAEVPVPLESKEKLFEEQEGKCANPSCQTEIILCGKSCHCDHIIPRADGGSNDLDNLQLLCVTCHLEKCAEEKEGGYGNFCPDYHSQFAPSVYEHILPHIHPLAFVEIVPQKVPEESKKETKTKSKVESVEINKDTKAQDILDSVTKGYITLNMAIKKIEMLADVYGTQTLKSRLQFLKTQSIYATQTLTGDLASDVQPRVKKIRKLGKEIEMKQSVLKEQTKIYDLETLRKIAEWQLDFKGHYPNLMKHRKEEWPKFSVMDVPKSFSGELQRAGWYYVKTHQTFPFRGSSWYPVITVKCGLDYRLINLAEIKFEYVPSDVLPPDHFVPYLNRIEQAFEGLEGKFTTSNSKSTKEWDFKMLMKAVKCSLIGAFAQKERHSEWVRATLSPCTAANWSISDGNDQECFVSQPLLHTDHKFNNIYIGQFRQRMAIESSACMIRAEVLEASSIAMFLIEQQTKSIGGTPLWRKTDAIGGKGPKIEIEEYFYDDEKECPMLQWEDPAPPKSERKPREIREPLADSIFHYHLGYQWFIDSSYDGDAQAMAQRLVDSKKGFNLCGRPGTGKTTLANAIIDLLEAQGLKYMAFSTTHVSKKRMGSLKSQLRIEKNANTIDSLYRRWRHKQEFVITICKWLNFILVDEISMMREKYYAMLCHIKRAIPGIKFILIGDIATQFLPVKDTWSGDYESSAALFDLCDGYKIKLSECLREEGDGKELFDICTAIINGAEIDISQFLPTADTRENIAYLHATRMQLNEEWMAKETKDLPEDQVIRLEAVPTDPHSQDVILCENMPVICIRKLESIGIDNGERFTILNFSDIPDYTSMKKEQLREHCRQKKLKVGGKNAELIERLQDASSDILLRLDDDEDAEPVRVPRHLFQKHFYVAYAITYFQSQGCTLTDRYTIWDWDFYHADWRAKNVAMSRATSKANVQIAPPQKTVKQKEKPGACFKCGELGHWYLECPQNQCVPCV